MNGVRYRSMLEDKLEINMAIYKYNIFMQDGAPCHRSKLMSDFPLKNNIKMLDWFDNSPVNPIENLRAILKDKVADKHPTSDKDWKWQ